MFGAEITYDDGKRARRLELEGYWIDYYESGDKLVVTFDPAGVLPEQTAGKRKPWAFDFLSKRGYSVLGVKYKQQDWYRGADLHAFFRSEELRALAARHAHIYLFGGSMGGYAALTFAEVFPGCTCLALNPQTTLAADLVPWDKRFPEAEIFDWTGDFRDGKKGAAAARTVYIIYDPFYRPDRLHVERLDQCNLVKLHLPFVGHAVPVWMGKMGILKPTIEGVLSGQLHERDFRKLAEVRKKHPRYYVKIAERKPRSRLAKACVERALSLDPADEDALFFSCKLHFAEKRHDEVLSTLDKMQDIQGLQFFAGAYLQCGMMEQADATLLLVLNKKDVTGKQLRMIKESAQELGRQQVVVRIAEECFQKPVFDGSLDGEN